MKIPALTLSQPWATLVAIGAKRIETRSWSANYRGSLLIHAAKTWSRDDECLCRVEPFRSVLQPIFAASLHALPLPMGAIVAVVQLADCRQRGTMQGAIPSDWDIPIWQHSYEVAFGNYTPGRWRWLLRGVRPLATPIPCRGHLQLWVPPADVLEQVRAQLGEMVPA